MAGGGLDHGLRPLHPVDERVERAIDHQPHPHRGCEMEAGPSLAHAVIDERGVEDRALDHAAAPSRRFAVAFSNQS